MPSVDVVGSTGAARDGADVNAGEPALAPVVVDSLGGLPPLTAPAEGPSTGVAGAEPPTGAAGAEPSTGGVGVASPPCDSPPRAILIRPLYVEGGYVCSYFLSHDVLIPDRALQTSVARKDRSPVCIPLQFFPPSFNFFDIFRVETSYESLASIYEERIMRGGIIRFTYLNTGKRKGDYVKLASPISVTKLTTVPYNLSEFFAAVDKNTMPYVLLNRSESRDVSIWCEKGFLLGGTAAGGSAPAPPGEGLAPSAEGVRGRSPREVTLLALLENAYAHYPKLSARHKAVVDAHASLTHTTTCSIDRFMQYVIELDKDKPESLKVQNFFHTLFVHHKLIKGFLRASYGTILQKYGTLEFVKHIAEHLVLWSQDLTVYNHVVHFLNTCYNFEPTSGLYAHLEHMTIEEKDCEVAETHQDLIITKQPITFGTSSNAENLPSICFFMQPSQGRQSPQVGFRCGNETLWVCDAFIQSRCTSFKLFKRMVLPQVGNVSYSTKYVPYENMKVITSSLFTRISLDSKCSWALDELKTILGWFPSTEVQTLTLTLVPPLEHGSTQLKSLIEAARAALLQYKFAAHESRVKYMVASAYDVDEFEQRTTKKNLAKRVKRS